MRTINAVALFLIVCLFPVDRVEAFAVQPQQMQPMLDQAFKEQRRQAIETASRQAAKEAAARRAQEQQEESAQQVRTAMFWGAGLVAGFVLMRKLRS
jgi:hypothetical protein